WPWARAGPAASDRRAAAARAATRGFLMVSSLEGHLELGQDGVVVVLLELAVVELVIDLELGPAGDEPVEAGRVAVDPVAVEVPVHVDGVGLDQDLERLRQGEIAGLDVPPVPGDDVVLGPVILGLE